MSATAQKLPPLMHFPLAKNLATAQGRSIRRVGWTGEPGAHEPTWIRYTGGVWWYQNASGERVAESGDVDEHQNAGLPADATVFGIQPSDLWDDMGMDAGLRDLANPNAETGAADCGSPTIKPPSPSGVVVFAPVVDPPSEELGGRWRGKRHWQQWCPHAASAALPPPLVSPDPAEAIEIGLDEWDGVPVGPVIRPIGTRSGFRTSRRSIC